MKGKGADERISALPGRLTNDHAYATEQRNRSSPGAVSAWHGVSGRKWEVELFGEVGQRGELDFGQA